MRRCSGRFVIERNDHIACCLTAEEISFTRTEGLKIAFPFLIGREDSEAVMRFEQVSCGSMVVVVGECFGDGRSLLEEAWEGSPLSASAKGDMFVCFCQFLTTYAEGILLSGICHVHLGIIPFFEVTQEPIHYLRIGAEEECSRILDDIPFGPWLSRPDLRHLRLDVEVGRDPVPAGLEVDILRLGACSGEYNRLFITATIYVAFRKEDGATGVEVEETADRCIP